MTPPTASLPAAPARLDAAYSLSLLLLVATSMVAAVTPHPLHLSAYPPLLVTLSLITGIAVGHVTAPFATTIMMLAAMLQRPPLQIIRWTGG